DPLVTGVQTCALPIFHLESFLNSPKASPVASAPWRGLPLPCGSHRSGGAVEDREDHETILDSTSTVRPRRFLPTPGAGPLVPSQIGRASCREGVEVLV